MNFIQRVFNAAYLMTLEVMYWIMITGFVQPTLRKYLGKHPLARSSPKTSLTPNRKISQENRSPPPTSPTCR